MSAEKTISVMVVEDQVLVLDAIATLLGLEDNIEVVAKCSNGAEAKQWLLENPPPAIVLTDIEMPEVSGLELAEFVQGNVSSRIVIMTTFAKPGYINRALKAGAKGFILKEADSSYLVESIQQVMGDNKVIAPELALMALEDNNPLSEKEASSIKLAGQGLPTKEIAKSLFLSEGTVRNYLSEAIAKLHATNRVDAYRIAHQKGWL
jgi:two-component system response regulator DesR